MMSNSVIITAIICMTLIAICLLNRDSQKEGAEDDGDD